MFKKLILAVLAVLGLGGKLGMSETVKESVIDSTGMRTGMKPGEVMPGYTEEEYRLYRSTGEEWGDKGAPEDPVVFKPATEASQPKQ